MLLCEKVIWPFGTAEGKDSRYIDPKEVAAATSFPVPDRKRNLR